MAIHAWLAGVVVLTTYTVGTGAEIREFSRLAQGLPTVEQSARDLPVTCQADVVVAGGGAAGVVAALTAAAEGLSVVLVEERNSLACEPTATEDQADAAPRAQSRDSLAAKLLAECRTGSKLDPKRCKGLLHRRVAEQARIRVFLFSMPVGIVLDSGRAGGLVVANRAGRQVFLAKTVIDATEDGRVVAAAGNKPLDGLVLAGPVSATAKPQSLAEALAHGETAGIQAVQEARKSPDWPATQPPSDKPAAFGNGAQVKELLAGPDSGTRYPVLRQAAVNLPISEEVDVLVVGGGTSGALAAIAAARQHVRVALVEILPNLGGTSSNRVTTYYWGVPWKSHLSEEIDAPIHVGPSLNKIGLGKFHFSGKEKKTVLADLAAKAGVKVHLRSFAAGAVVQGNSLLGAVVENADGRQVILARVVIDATGHADVAAAAGAAFDVGRPYDGFVHEAEHGPLRDALDPEDISKFYVRSPQSVLSLNLRESRRIRGDYTVTFDDVLASRRFPDVVARWRSNYDTHFPHSANQEARAQDWMAILGLFRKPLWGDIPYRGLLPQGWENILVVGKAWSATHDALIGARMQRDLQHLGEASGVAAALACQGRTTPRALPIARLQDELVRLRVLLPEDVTESHLVHGTAPRIDLAAMAQRLGGEQALDAMVELYLAGGDSVPHVLPLLQSENAAVRTEAALVLGMLGRQEAVPVLLERLAARDPRTFAFKLPDASNRPSVPVFWSAAILLGRLRAAEAAGPIRELIQDPDKCPPSLASFAIVALGQLGDRSAIGLIRPYLRVSKPVGLREENMRSDAQWGVQTNAARVLAQLGDHSGVPVLIGLLEADQSQLRSYAQRLLEEATGQRFGKDRRAWEDWLRRTKGAQ